MPAQTMPTCKPPIALLLLLLGLWGQGQAQNELSGITLSLYRQETRLTGNGTTGPYPLPDHFILVESEKITIDNVLQRRETDYVMDYDSGDIFFSRPVPQGSEIQVRYHRLPLGLKRSYQLTFPSLPQNRSRLSLPSRQAVPAPQAGPDKTSLKIGGSKSLGISIGSDRDLSLEQSLRLDITGQLAKNLEVTALLSDQSSPLQPEGTTQTLEELDKVSIEVRGRNILAAFGDYALAWGKNEFGQLNRKLEGVHGELRLPSTQLAVAGASSRGTFITNRFMGIEGNQGPYQLATERQATGIIVLAGTEKIWVDGDLMSRGENNDYTIDYANGQITFTRRRLITADSRIVVDFEYMEDAYRRTLYAGSGWYTLAGKHLQLGAAYVQESDDREDPLAMTLSDENQALLEAAGDSANAAFYYTDDSTKVWLPLPRSHSLADLNLHFSTGLVEASGEVGFSRYDQNTFSTRDDGDVNGQAYKVSGTFQTPPMVLGGRHLGTVQLHAFQRRLDSTFRSLGRTEIAEYNRRWDLPADFENRQQQVSELVTTYRGGKSTIGLTLGRLESGPKFESSRKEVQADIGLQGLPHISYLGESIDSRNAGQAHSSDRVESTWSRNTLNSRYDVWTLQSKMVIRAERKQVNQSEAVIDGFKFYEMGGDLSTKDLGPFRAFTGLLFRKDWTHDGDWLQASRSQTLRQGLSLDTWRSVSSSLEYTHRRKELSGTGKTSQTTDLADIRIHYTPLAQAINSSLRYQISGLQAAGQQRQFIDVGTWQGSYRYDELTGEYIYDPGREDSRFLLQTKAAGDYEPVIELNAGFNLRIQPERYYRTWPHASALATWLSMIESETTIDIREQTKEKNRWSIYLFDMSRFQQDNTTVEGRIRLRQELLFTPRTHGLKVRLRYEKHDDENNQFLEEENIQVIGEERLRTEHSLKIQGQAAISCDLQTELKKERIRRQVQGLSIYDVDSRSLAADIGFRPRPPIQLSLNALWDHDEDQPTGQRSVALVLTPGFSYSIPEKGRIRANASWTHVSVTDQRLPLFYTMAQNKPAGENFDWSLSVDYRLHRYLIALISYTGRSESERQIVHTGKAEMRAFF